MLLRALLPVSCLLAYCSASGTIIRLEPEFTCLLQAPTCLSFVEPLVASVRPDQVTIFTGGDSLERRQKGFSRMSADSITAFASHHGYNLVFLDQLEFTRPSVYKNVTFTPHWHRIFALESLRQRFPESKYFLWMDDDIVIPYQETEMLNHWVNQMEADHDWQIMYAAEVDGYYLNSGMFIFKNDDFPFHLYSSLLDLGVQQWAAKPLYEQSALVELLKRLVNRDLQVSKIRRIKAREGPYTFNGFYRCAMAEEHQNNRYRHGDAFAHLLGTPDWLRDIYARELMEEVERWRQIVPSHCRYPINTNFRL